MILSPRYLPRLAATIGLFTRYGLRDVASQQGLLDLAPDDESETSDDERDDLRSRAAGFRTRLVELGPAYVKLGQVLSTRPDLLPPAYIQELEQLQDDVGPIPYEDVEATIEAELGGRLAKLFDEFEREPLATASLGQVHAATLRDGRAVAVKIQRPNIREQLADDIEFFRELARFMTEHTKAGKRVDMIGVIQQLERALADELDYRLEARNAALLRRSLAEFPHILIPRVIGAYSTTKVLTVERVRGTKITDIAPVARLEHDFTEVADEFARAYLKQITIDGHFHADPHPGNIFVILPGVENPRTPSELAASERRATRRPAVTELTKIEAEAQRDAAPIVPQDGRVKLALIDFGMTARLPGNLKDGVVRLLLAIADDRGDDAAGVLVELGETLEGFDRVAYEREIATIVARNHDLTVGDIRAGLVLYEVINLSFDHGLRLPAQLALLAKALFNLDAVSRALDPSYSPIDAIRSYSTRVADERAKRELSPQRLMQMASEAGNFLAVLPHRLDVITKRIAQNELGLKIDAPQVTTLLAGLQKVANRIFSGLVLTGLLIASAMLLPHSERLGTAGFVIAAAIGMYMVASILLSDRRERRTRIDKSG
ncbi:MAG TPA: AarF/UbiB family protein [Gemmatimonadaceae bacterium]